MIVLVKFFDDVPDEYYEYYASGEATLPASTQDDGGQTGYFKTQLEWDWKVPDYAGWSGYAWNPRNCDIVVLTASDGGGHNSVIPNVLERVLDDREKYCARHGYTNLWLNTSRYNIGAAHKVGRRNEDLLVLNACLYMVTDLV